MYPVTWNAPVFESKDDFPEVKIELSMLYESTQYLGLKMSVKILEKSKTYKDNFLLPSPV